mmetsp:Transcript_2311/g.5392  ORF Transcript_2311/g.5392 Transcript_2311/m.5392 type:complete len:220 (+) Transcript_2311:439-1098(+)
MDRAVCLALHPIRRWDCAVLGSGTERGAIVHPVPGQVRSHTRGHGWAVHRNCEKPIGPCRPSCWVSNATRGPTASLVLDSARCRGLYHGRSAVHGCGQQRRRPCEGKHKPDRGRSCEHLCMEHHDRVLRPRPGNGPRPCRNFCHPLCDPRSQRVLRALPCRLEWFRFADAVERQRVPLERTEREILVAPRGLSSLFPHRRRRSDHREHGTSCFREAPAL